MTHPRTSVGSTLVAALVAALVSAAGPALAQQKGAGYVSNLSGPLFVVKSDGSRRVLSTQSEVSAGDTLVTEDKTYARVRFSDTSEVTLRPGTQLQIEAYNFDRDAPQKDNVAFRMLKGALRAVSGLIGHRGNEDAYKLATESATIGIRGTVFGVTVCVPGTCGNLGPGTYVNVIEGRVAVAPPAVVPAIAMPTLPAAPPGVPAGAPPVAAPAAAPLVLAAGQFGYAPSAGPPVQLPGDPGVGPLFAPPPSFTQRQDAPPPVQGPGTPAAKPAARSVFGECEVQ